MRINRVYAILLRHYFLSIHQLDRFFGLFFYPAVGLLLWGFLAKYVQQTQSVEISSFLLGGLILWIIFETVQGEISFSFMFELWEKNLVNLLASPLTIFEFLFGLIFLGILKIIITLSFMGLLASVLYNFNITILGFGLAAFWINLLIFGWAFGIFSISLVSRFGQSLGALTWSLPFLLQPFAAVFYPVSALPYFAQRVAMILPVSYVFEGMREFLKTGHFNLSQFFIALLLNLVYLSISLSFFYFIIRYGKKSGKLVKLV